MVVGARQRIQFFRQKTWFLGNIVAVEYHIMDAYLGKTHNLVFHFLLP